MTDQIELFAPIQADIDPMDAPVIASPEHPYHMPVDTYAGNHGRTASIGLEELKSLGYTIEHFWELEINETYNIDLPDGVVTTAAKVIDRDGNRLLLIWDAKPGNFFCDNEIIRPGEKEINMEGRNK